MDRVKFMLYVSVVLYCYQHRDLSHDELQNW